MLKKNIRWARIKIRLDVFLRGKFINATANGFMAKSS